MICHMDQWNPDHQLNPDSRVNSFDVKFHIFHPAHNPTQTLCGRLEIADCLSFGAEPPGDVCKICLAKNSGGRTVALEG